MNELRKRDGLKCAACLIVVAALAGGLCARGQTAAGEPVHPVYDVATVKPVLQDSAHPFTGKHFWAHVRADGASYWSMTLEQLIGYAYGANLYLVTGPDWTGEQRFDIEARFADGTDKTENLMMLRALLKDRFNLLFHVEEKQVDGYALVVGKHGAKLTPSLAVPANVEASAAPKPGENKAGEGDAKPGVMHNHDGSFTIDRGEGGTETFNFVMDDWANHWVLSKSTMEGLATRLSICFGGSMSKVVDETGIKGNYQVAYDCPLPGRPAQTAAAGGSMASDPEGGSSLNRSLDELGLKLEKRKVPEDVYVIDHVERPSAN